MTRPETLNLKFLLILSIFIFQVFTFDVQGFGQWGEGAIKWNGFQKLRTAQKGFVSLLPEKDEWVDPQAYSMRSYWDDFYRQNSDGFEWCLDYKDISNKLKEKVGGAERVLMLGCGNSNLTLEMYHDGWSNIVNVDYSPLVIETMAERYKSLDGLSWLCMDARHLDLPENSFDAIVDKGLLDAMACSDAFDLYIPQIASSCCKVLKEGGSYFCTSFCQPSVITPLLEGVSGWNVNVEKIAGKFYLYLCQKNC